MLTVVVSSCFVVEVFVVVVVVVDVFVSAAVELCVGVVVASSCGCAVINKYFSKISQLYLIVAIIASANQKADKIHNVSTNYGLDHPSINTLRSFTRCVSSSITQESIPIGFVPTTP